MKIQEEWIRIKGRTKTEEMTPVKNTIKKLFSVLIVLALIGSMFPAVAAQSENTQFTQQDYASVDALFDDIDRMESEPARKNATEAQLADAAEALVKASDDYVPGSLERNGNAFTYNLHRLSYCGNTGIP